MRSLTGKLRILLCGIAAIAAGCGYSGGAGRQERSGYQWGSVYRQDVQSVAVPIFTNATFHRGVELTLSKAIANQIEATTPYRLAARERADSILEGQVVDVSIGRLSNDPHSGIPQEQLMVVTVDFSWKDLRSGRVLVHRERFEQVAPYYPTLGEGRFAGQQTAVEKLAVAIVQEMQSDW